jgi:hypothetical protein
MSQQEPSEEQMRAALEEQMRHIRVEDVLLQTVVTLINLGARRLGLTGPEDAGETDPHQAQLAIEGARALMPLVPAAEETQPIRDALSQLQMAFVQRVQGAGEGPGAEEQGATSEEPSAPAPSPAAPDDAEERAKARSKLWTPPGT